LLKPYNISLMDAQPNPLGSPAGQLAVGYGSSGKGRREPWLVEKGPMGLRGRWAHWREHGTPDWLLLYTLSGMGRIGHGDGVLIVRPGDLLVFRPGTPHGVGFTTESPRWDTIWAHFIPRREWYDWLDWPEETKGLMKLSLSDNDMRNRIVHHLKEAVRLATGPHPHREALGMNALEAALLWCETVNPRSKQARLDFRVRRALDYICHNLSQNIPLNALAKHCGLSRSRLAHLFRAQVGRTPQQFVEIERLNRARQLLEFTQHTVSEVAFQVGYRNPFYFSLRFKRHTRLSPSAYRRRRLATR
jgi:AraC family transcriptional regulator of arabinose operon